MAERLVVSLDGEGLELAPGENWDFEEFTCAASPSREMLLDGLCARIERHHPRRTGFKAPPLGWCSWYCFGPNVTVPDIGRDLGDQESWVTFEKGNIVLNLFSIGVLKHGAFSPESFCLMLCHTALYQLA